MVAKKMFAAKLISKVLRKGGETISNKRHINERLEACRGCYHFGKVELPIVGLDFDEGCTLCKCPLVTKTKMLKIARLPEDLGTPISPKELAKIALGFDNKKRVPEKVTCSNANKEYENANGKDYWSSIDQKYLKEIN